LPVSVEQVRRRVHLEPAVDEHPQRLTRRVDQAHVHLRIIGLDGADAGQHRARTSAPCVPVAPCLFGGDPLRAAIFECRLAVEARCDLHPHPGTAADHAREKTLIELGRLVA
jgi:hypothetical protein